MSNELSTLIATYKGNHTSAELIAGAKISRETFRKIERGQSVKLKTLNAIAVFLDLDHSAWIKLVIAWMRIEAGDDAKWIELTARQTANLKEEGPDGIETEITKLVTQLSASDRRQIVLTIARPEVRRTLPAINALYDTLRGLKT